jgi:predicted DNA-binding transcriptional regulator AlpA
VTNLRVRDAAKYCGLSKSYLDKARCYGGGPAYFRLGRSVVYAISDLDTWMAANRTAPANDNELLVVRVPAFRKVQGRDAYVSDLAEAVAQTAQARAAA